MFAFFGFTLAEIGKRLPILRNIGGAAIFATFIPSALVYYKVLPEPIVKVTTDFTKVSNFLYLFIASIIVGSILSMDRKVLIKGFLKIFVPLAAGTIAAALRRHRWSARCSAWAPTTRSSSSSCRSWPAASAKARSRCRSATPRSCTRTQGALFATVLPPVMLGSLTAIVFAGMLNYVGKRYPHLTGEGRLQPGEHDDMDPSREEITGHMDVSHIAAAGITALTLYLLGILCQRLFGLPAPVAMLFLAVLVKLTQAVSPQLQEGAFVVYKFFSTAVTYPLLFAIGVVADAVGQAGRRVQPADHRSPSSSTVATLMATGFAGRPLAEDVPDRGGDRQRLPQRPGRHRRRRDPDRGQPHDADALRADRHAHRRRHHRDAGADHAVPDRLTLLGRSPCNSPDCCTARRC